MEEKEIQERISALKIFVKETEIYEHYIKLNDEYYDFRKQMENSLKYIKENTKDNFVKNHITSILIKEGFDVQIPEVTDETID